MTKTEKLDGYYQLSFKGGDTFSGVTTFISLSADYESRLMPTSVRMFQNSLRSKRLLSTASTVTTFVSVITIEEFYSETAEILQPNANPQKIFDSF